MASDDGWVIDVDSNPVPGTYKMELSCPCGSSIKSAFTTPLGSSGAAVLFVFVFLLLFFPSILKNFELGG